MPDQNLFFNILTFDWPKENLIFYFSKTDDRSSSRIYKSNFPIGISSVFPDIHSENLEFIYTTFTYKKEGFIPLEIDASIENPDLIKQYYNRQINYYFRKVIKLIVKRGFIGENQIWTYSKKVTNSTYNIYERFSFKVQLCSVSQFPELLISYDGRSRVLKSPVSQVVKSVSQSKFINVVYKGRVLNFEDLVNEIDLDYSKAYPILNPKLEDALGIDVETIPKSNRYKSYFGKVDEMRKYLHSKSDFKKLIPLNELNFYSVPEELISKINEESNNLAFHEKEIGRTPKIDFRKLKPFKKCPHQNVHLFFIYHENDEATKDKLQDNFENGTSFYRGLTEYAGILFHTDESSSISFSNKLNPIPEISQGIERLDLSNPEIKYLAIYLTPYTKAETSKQEVRVYIKVKEMLLNRGIASQFVEPANVNGEKENDFVFSLTNMSVAILAKLDGIPWQLGSDFKNELIIGIGAFRHYADQVQYVSSAISFDNTGRFHQFEYFMKYQVDVLAGSIATKVREFTASVKPPDRIIIHFYKQLSEKELAPIEKALLELKLPNPVPIFIVTINKTEAKDIFVFDASWLHLMPISGTYISIGNKKYVLCNNARYNNNYNPKDGFPFPVKLAIDCTEPQLLENDDTINELINQVYQFSRLYFKSVMQQNLPVTIKYPEMIAEIAPYFDEKGIPPLSKSNLWFL